MSCRAEDRSRLNVFRFRPVVYHKNSDVAGRRCTIRYTKHAHRLHCVLPSSTIHLRRDSTDPYAGNYVWHHHLVVYGYVYNNTILYDIRIFICAARIETGFSREPDK